MKETKTAVKLTPAQAYAAHLKAQKRAEAADRRNPDIAADNARINAMFNVTEKVAQRKVAKARKTAPVTHATVKVTDAEVLEVFLLSDAEKYVFEGGYADVWVEVVDALGVTAQYAHFRALQLARVGRQFETLTGVSFATVCPGLPAVASNWVSDLG